MTGGDALPPAILRRKAVVYIRQSTQAQVETNLEGRRRQYELADLARRKGFRTVEVIDDDLGAWPSGSRTIATTRSPRCSDRSRFGRPASAVADAARPRPAWNGRRTPARPRSWTGCGRRSPPCWRTRRRAP